MINSEGGCGENRRNKEMDESGKYGGRIRY